MNNDKLFDPLWRDDIINEEVLNIPLVLPPSSKPNNRVWISKKVVRNETVFGKDLNSKKPRIITAMVKKGRSSPSTKITDENGNKVPEDSAIWDFINPPKAWMTDSAEELLTMYSAAKEARGDVLVGGLGMGIFPQMAFFLKRPVDSFTIIDNNPDVIEITTSAWLDCLDDDKRDKIKIIEQPFEDYIKTTKKKFDTIFVDLWEDSDPRFLPYINLLVNLIKPLCKKGGRIYIWAYALTVDSFVKLVNFYETSNIDIQKIPAPIDPLITKYGQWRAQEENTNLHIDEYEKKARELALTEKLTDLNYNRDLYFIPFSESRAERHILMQILKLAKRENTSEKNNSSSNT